MFWRSLRYFVGAIAALAAIGAAIAAETFGVMPQSRLMTLTLALIGAVTCGGVTWLIASEVTKGKRLAEETREFLLKRK